MLTPDVLNGENKTSAAASAHKKPLPLPRNLIITTKLRLVNTTSGETAAKVTASTPGLPILHKQQSVSTFYATDEELEEKSRCVDEAGYFDFAALLPAVYWRWMPAGDLKHILRSQSWNKICCLFETALLRRTSSKLTSKVVSDIFKVLHGLDWKTRNKSTALHSLTKTRNNNAKSGMFMWWWVRMPSMGTSIWSYILYVATWDQNENEAGWLEVRDYAGDWGVRSL